MSQENVEIIRRFAEVFETGDLERIVSEFLDPEIEWRTLADDPDAATHQGPEAYKRYVEQWWEGFEGLHAEVEEYIDAGDDRIFTWFRWTGRGRVSGADAAWHQAIIYTMRDGKIALAEEYFDRDEALKAAGLSEQDARADS
jgi:ketosteroid isomerase-like protein